MWAVTPLWAPCELSLNPLQVPKEAFVNFLWVLWKLRLKLWWPSVLCLLWVLYRYCRTRCKSSVDPSCASCASFVRDMSGISACYPAIDVIPLWKCLINKEAEHRKRQKTEHVFADPEGLISGRFWLRLRRGAAGDFPMNRQASEKGSSLELWYLLSTLAISVPQFVSGKSIPHEQKSSW